MSTVEFITTLFFEVDEQLRAIPKHPEAHLWPGASKSLRRFFPIFGAWSCLELLSSHGNHRYVAV
jgi:hypothetical protein